MKCYFNDCPNSCTTEVVTGLSWDVETNQRTQNWNPVCDSCIAKTNWTFLTTRPFRPHPVDSGISPSKRNCEGAIPSWGSNYMQEELITVGTFNLASNLTEKVATLYGTAGGQLEFVSMRTTTRKVYDRWQKFVIIVFTDHDLQAVPEDGLQDAGLKPYYELVFPIE